MMSELQSVSSLTGKGNAVKWVDANGVIQQILQNLEAEHRRDLVLRCDELDYVQAPAEEVEAIFAGLLQLILQLKETLPRLFLHISCKNNLVSPDSAPEMGLLRIQFNTNISPSINRMPLHEQTITRISTAVQKNGGSFEVVQGTPQGCIFSVSLPGKSL